MVVEDDKNAFNSIFRLMEKSNVQDLNEVTLLYLKDDLDTHPIENLRKLGARVIDYVHERTTENLILNEKLSLCEDENSALKYQISELSVWIGILETDSRVPKERRGTSKDGKRKLSAFEEEHNEKIKTSEFKLVAFLETNAQLWRDLTQVSEELNHSLKWNYFFKILSNLSSQSFNGKQGMDCRPIEPPCNPHSKYMYVVDNLQ